MMMFALIGILALIGFYIIRRKATNESGNVGGGNLISTDAYTIYTDWCREADEVPIVKEEFEKLANAQGGISLADLIDRHAKINSNRKEDELRAWDDSNSECEPMWQLPKDEQRMRDEKFMLSALAGNMTNSTTKGALFGGSLLGGMFGDYLNKKDDPV